MDFLALLDEATDNESKAKLLGSLVRADKTAVAAIGRDESCMQTFSSWIEELVPDRSSFHVLELLLKVASFSFLCSSSACKSNHVIASGNGYYSWPSLIYWMHDAPMELIRLLTFYIKFLMKKQNYLANVSPDSGSERMSKVFTKCMFWTGTGTSASPKRYTQVFTDRGAAKNKACEPSHERHPPSCW